MRASQWLTSVDFPTPAQAMIVTTFICWFAHAASRKAMSSSRPKTSLPVTGSLAIEIFFGPGLDGGLRVRAGEAVGDIFTQALAGDSAPCLDSSGYRRYSLQKFA